MIPVTLTEEKKMVLFPNQTIAHPDDVRERVEEKYDEHEAGPQPQDLVDEASRDSFPASDAPPWTLGYIGRPAQMAEVCGGVQKADSP